MSVSKQNHWTAFEILDIPLRYVLEIKRRSSAKKSAVIVTPLNCTPSFIEWRTFPDSTERLDRFLHIALKLMLGLLNLCSFFRFALFDGEIYPLEPILKGWTVISLRIIRNWNLQETPIWAPQTSRVHCPAPVLTRPLNPHHLVQI